jgi:predicted TIM-barrel enzyme
MTTLSLTLSATRPIRFYGPIRVLRDLGRFFTSIAAAQQATVDFERMNNRTDAQLSNEGMHRADVARVVFERHFV